MYEPDDAPPVDNRVEGAIEDLNAAADSLNIVEDTKSAAERAAQRAAMVVREELAMLQHDHAKLVKYMEPFLAVRAAAMDAIQEARRLEAVWRLAKTVEMDAKQASGSSWTPPWSAKPLSSKDMAAKQAEAEAKKSAAEAKRAASKASKLAEHRSVRLGELGVGLERAGFHDVKRAEQAYISYMEKRRGFEAVLHASEERLRQLEAAKELAQQRHADAMDSLEALSEELSREQESRRPSVCVCDASRPGNGSSAPDNGTAAMSAAASHGAASSSSSSTAAVTTAAPATTAAAAGEGAAAIAEELDEGDAWRLRPSEVLSDDSFEGGEYSEQSEEEEQEVDDEEEREGINDAAASSHEREARATSDEHAEQPAMREPLAEPFAAAGRSAEQIAEHEAEAAPMRAECSGAEGGSDGRGRRLSRAKEPGELEII